MNLRKQARLRRAKRSRKKMQELRAVRLSVHRTPRHIYAQVIDPDGAVLATASSLEKALASHGYTGNIAMAKHIGQTIAERAKKAGVTQVAFDRSGFQYHGRVKALAEAVREHGIQM
jgi:large subunit ribosomal protein L18